MKAFILSSILSIVLAGDPILQAAMEDDGQNPVKCINAKNAYSDQCCGEDISTTSFHMPLQVCGNAYDFHVSTFPAVNPQTSNPYTVNDALQYKASTNITDGPKSKQQNYHLFFESVYENDANRIQMVVSTLTTGIQGWKNSLYKLAIANDANCNSLSYGCMYNNAESLQHTLYVPKEDYFLYVAELESIYANANSNIAGWATWKVHNYSVAVC